MTIGKGRISKKKSGNRGYGSYWIYIPSKMSGDAAFPFRDKEEVNIELKGSTLIVNKIFNLNEITEKYGLVNATLPELLEKKALANRSLPLIYFKNQSYSYQETNEMVNRIANGLLNLTKESKLNNPKIAILLPNCPDYIFWWLGVAKTGYISVLFNYLSKGPLLVYLLQNSNAEILIIDFEFLKHFEEISAKVPNIKQVLIRNAPKEFNFNDKFLDVQAILSDNCENPKTTINNLQPLEIIYTSGTTGKPKGILYRNYYTLSGISVGRKLEALGINQTPYKIYCPRPLFQAFFQYLVIIPAMLYNASVIITDKFDISTFWDEVMTFKPDIICYFGAQLTALVKEEPKEFDRMHSIKYAFGMGAFKETWEAFERRFGIRIIEGWSTVEGVGVALNIVGSKGGKIGSVGPPIRGFEMKIVDSNGKELPPGRDNIGEIAARFRLPFELEYYNLEESTTTRKGEDRWVYTGDFGYEDQDGFIYFLGRQSDMFYRGNETFFAKDIEIITNSHPRIIESAVFEVSIKDSSEKFLKICAVLKDGSSMTHEELHDYLKENLAYFMVPRFIEFKKNLPKNANELVQKFILIKEWGNKNARKNTYDSIAKEFIT